MRKVGDGGTGQVQAIQEAPPVVTAVHAGQDPVGSALEGQVELLAHVRHVAHRGEHVGGEVLRVGAGEAHPLQPVDVAEDVEHLGVLVGVRVAGVARRRLDEGERPHFLAQTKQVRDGDWTIAPIPKALECRRVEITGPVDPKMVINAFNSGADSYMTDFEDSNAPNWTNQIQGQVNLRRAIRRELTLEQGGKTYRLNEKIATLQVRPRGWHLDEKHVKVDGQRVSGGIFDFALFMFHNAKEQLSRGAGPYFYLPKLESHLEARLWNDIFVATQKAIGLPQGTIKATVLIETILAAFEMDEILYELREHSAGLNAGRWDYIFSCIKKFKVDRDFCLADRAKVTMTSPFMRAYALLLLMVLIWGANFSVAKVALESVPPLAFNALRFPCAAIAVFIVMRLRGAVPRPAPRDISRIVVLALLGNVMYQQFFIFGLDNTVTIVGNVTRDPELRALPVGTVDPMLKLVGFYDGEEPLAVLTWFATHPQSYYRTKLASVDFPGIARAARESESGVPHLHFNGAGGNVGAGKWNDGSPENRQVLADRMAALLHDLGILLDGTFQRLHGAGGERREPPARHGDRTRGGIEAVAPFTGRTKQTERRHLLLREGEAGD